MLEQWADEMVLAAEADPAGFFAELPERVVLDEVQRVPSLFTALKVVVDPDRVPGRFLLTGSANRLAILAGAVCVAGTAAFSGCGSFKLILVRWGPNVGKTIRAGSTGEVDLKIAINQLRTVGNATGGNRRKEYKDAAGGLDKMLEEMRICWDYGRSDQAGGSRNGVAGEVRPVH